MIDLFLYKGRKGEVYNIGGHNEWTNNQTADIIVNRRGLSRKLIKYVDDCLGQDIRYAIDSTKI